MSDVINTVIISIVLFFWILIAIRFFISRFSPVKTTKAEICDKYINTRVSAYPKMLGGDKHMVVFSCGKKKLSFPVSEFSYDTYKVGEKGTLKYKGGKIISFK